MRAIGSSHSPQEAQVPQKLNLESINSLLAQLPNPIMSTSWQANDSMTSYLQRECTRYNTILSNIRDDLLRISKYLECVNCERCDDPSEILKSLELNEVPQRWHQQYILAKRDLRLWIEEFRRNFEILKRWWVKEERPRFININMLFYP